jgi:predicted kinase
VDGRLIIVTGAPGVGKSTVARAMAEAWPGPRSAHIRADDIYTYFVKGYVPPWDPASLDQNVAVMNALAAQAAALAQGGYPVFVDGIVGPWFLGPFKAAAIQSGARLHYLVLRPTREAAIARGVAREGHPMRDPAVIGAMWDQFADLGDLEAHAMDTTACGPEETAISAAAALQSDRLRLA